MANPAKTCKVKVSEGIYAHWLVNEYPQDWQWEGTQAVQRFVLVRTMTGAHLRSSSKRIETQAWYEPVKV